MYGCDSESFVNPVTDWFGRLVFSVGFDQFGHEADGQTNRTYENQHYRRYQERQQELSCFGHDSSQENRRDCHQKAEQQQLVRYRTDRQDGQKGQAQKDYCGNTNRHCQFIRHCKHSKSPKSV